MMRDTYLLMIRIIYIVQGNRYTCYCLDSQYAYSPTIKQKPCGRGLLIWLLVIEGFRYLILPCWSQPMSFKNGRFWITFNGTIYNYLDIKNELQKIGYQFISGTDTEVVLAAYAECGTECLNRFVGMWAFAIYDHKLKEIFLARDRYGIKPIYYWFSPEGHFCFASEIKQFTVCKGGSQNESKDGIYDYLVYSFTTILMKQCLPEYISFHPDFL